MTKQEILTIRQYIIDHAPEAGLETANADLSQTSFGISAYVNLSNPVERWTMKVRISDHSFGVDRSATETSVWSIEDAEKILFPERFIVRDVPSGITHTLRIGAVDLKEGDEIISEFTSKRGNLSYEVRRPQMRTVYERAN